MARESVENVLAALDGRLDPAVIVNGCAGQARRTAR